MRLVVRMFGGTVQQQDAVAEHRAELFHPPEQLGALAAGRVFQMFNDGRQIDPNRLHRVFERTPLMRGRALRLARSANFSEVNNLGHDLILADFFARATLVFDGFPSAPGKPSDLMGYSVQNIKLAPIKPCTPEDAAQRKHYPLGAVLG
jgi:hypothetical protein